MRKAAEARAELDALKKSSMEETSAETTGNNQAATARNSNVNSIQRETTALGQLGQAAKQANVQTAYGGRDSMQQHLSDLQTETNLTTLLNRQHWLGFSSPQQAFSFMQQQYQQKLLSNRADFAGYQTADQYLGYLQRQIASYSALAAAIRTRQAAIQSETAAMLANTNATKGTHSTISQLGEAGSTVTSNLNAYSDAINNLPDTVETDAVFDTTAALASLRKYRAELSATPTSEHTVLATSQVRGAQPLLAPESQTVYEHLVSQMPGHLDTTARFDIAQAVSKAAELRAAYASVPRVVSTAGVVGGSGVLGSFTEDITPTMDTSSIDEEFQELAANMAQLRGDAQRDPITPRVNIEPAEEALHKLGQTEHIVVDESTTPVAAGGSAGGLPPPVVPPTANAGGDEGDDEEFRKIAQAAAGAQAAEDAAARAAQQDFGPNPNDVRAWEQLSLMAEAFGDDLDKVAQQDAGKFQQLSLDMEHFQGTVGGGFAPNPNDAQAFKTLASEVDQTTRSARDSITALRDLAVSADTAAAASRYAYAANVLQSAAERSLGTDAEGMVRHYAALASGAKDAAQAAQFANAAQQLLSANLYSTRNEAAEAGVALLAAGRAADAAGAEAGGSSGRWGFLTKQLSLFGGFFGDNHLIGQVALWHVLLDGLVEIFALWVPALVTATLGLAAWGAAGYRAGKEVAEQLYNAYTVGQALNTTVKPLTDNFSKMAQAVKPQVYELFGDALDVMNSRSGVFNQLIQQTGTYLERFASRVVIDMQRGKGGFQDFLETGEKDLALIGQGFDQLGVILGKFLAATALTHIAEDLAAVGDFILRIVADVLKVTPTPVLALVLGLHGLVLWGGLATTIVTKLATGILSLASRFDVLNKAAYSTASFIGASNASLEKMIARGPEVEAVINAIGDPKKAEQVAQLANYIKQTGLSYAEFASASGPAAAAKLDDLTAGMGDAERDTVGLGMAAGVTGKDLEGLAESAGKGAGQTGLMAGAMGLLKGVSTGTWIAVVVAALGAATYAIASAKDATQDWVVQMDKALQSSSVYGLISQTVSDLAAATDKLAIAQKTGVGNAGELSSAQNDLSGKLQAELTHVGDISHAYGVSLPSALALAQTAGVSTTQLFSTQNGVWAEAEQQIRGLVTGYQAMGQQMGAIGSDMNVLAVSESAQVSSMSKLNSAWDDWTKNLAGAPTALIATAQGFAQLQKDAKTAGASMEGLNAPSLTLQQDFQSNYSNVEQLFDAFRNTQALSGGGNFTAFVKDAVAALLPMTGGSKEAVAQVSALAQEAGGPATTSLQTLQKWVGNVKDPLLQMQRATNSAAIGASSLSQDAQRLSTTLQQELDPAMAKASFSAYGGQKAFSTFATDLVKFGPNAKPTIEAGKAVAQELLSVDKNSAQAKAQFVGWAESMGLSKTQASTLWAEVSKGESPMKSLNKNLADGATGADQLGKHLGKSGLLGQMRDLTVQGGSQIGGFFGKTMPHLFVEGGHAIETGWNATTHAVSDAWSHVWSAVASPVEKGFDSVKRAITTGFDGWWKDHGKELEQIWSQVWATLSTPVVDAVHTIERVWGGVSHVISDSLSKASGPAKMFQQGLDQIWAGIAGNAKIAWSIITTAARIAWAAITTGAKIAADGFVAVFKFAFDTLVFAFNEVIDLLTGHWGQAWTDMRHYAEQVWNILRTEWTQLWNSLVGFAKTLWSDLFKPAGAWFNTEVIQPIRKFFMGTIVSYLSSAGKAFAQTWVSAWADFDRDVVQKVQKFLVSTVPSYLASAGKSFAQTWVSAWDAFDRDVLQPVQKFLTSTVPGWLSTLVTRFAAGWTNIWNAFSRDVLSPIERFLTSSVPGWISSLTGRFASGWKTVWNDFSRDVLSPMESFFTKSLPSAISSGVRTGINEAITGIDKVIGFINNDVLAHLPGGLKIPTVAKLAAGGVAPARLGGSIPGTGDEDGTHIIAMGGEYMLRKPARMALDQAYGPNFLNSLNQADSWLNSGSRGNTASQGVPMGTPRYAGGGGILGSIEGLLSGVGSTLSSGAKGLLGYVEGGASELTKLAGEGAKYVFDAVWNHTIKPMVSGIGGANIGGDIMQDAASDIKTGIDRFLTNQDSSAKSQASSSGGITMAGVVNSSAEAALKSAAAKAGWTGAEWNALRQVEMDEAGFNIHAQNPTSDAYGMAQFINGASEYAQYGGNANTAAGQSVAMVNYIKQRYGDPEAALAHENAYHWYARGGALSYAAGNSVVSAIEQATSNEHMRESMAIGSWLSSRWNPTWDKNGFYGAFQLPLSKAVTASEANNPVWSAKYMLPAYTRAVNAVGTKLWGSTPSQAAILAAQTAQNVNFTKYQGASELSTGWKAVEEALGAAAPAKTSTAATGPSSSMSSTDAWSYYAKLLPTDVTAESNAFYALSGHTLPTGKGKATTEQWAQWHALLGILQTNQLKAIGQNQGGDYEKLTNATDNWSLPGGASESLWTQFTTDLTNQYNWIRDDPTPPSSVWGWEPKSTWPAKFKDSKGRAPGHIPPSGWAAWKYENGLWSSAVKALGTLHATEAGAQKAWNGLWGPSGSITKSAPTPGVSVVPVGSSGPINVNLDSLIQGGPALPVFDVTGGSLSGTGNGFAAGGSLSDVAGMFAMGGSIPMTIAPAGGDGLVSSLTTANNRTLSDAAQSSSVGLQVQGDLNINNPRSEKPSESITRSSQRLSFLAGRGAV